MDYSIIIPTLNEEDNLAELLTCIQLHSGVLPKEVIVADAGSQDATERIAREHGVQFILAQKGRSIQMNAGAQAASAKLLYFIHADTRPPKNFGTKIIQASTQGASSGCFNSIFDIPSPFLRFGSFFTRLPFWFCRGGGQTLFVKRDLFISLGGFNEEMVLMEEYQLIERLKRKGKFQILKGPAITSGRDYEEHGTIKLQMIYSYIFFLYWKGASQERLLQVKRRWLTKKGEIRTRTI